MGLALGQCLGLFNAENGIMISSDIEWLQGALNVLIGILWRCGLVENVAKSKAMTCQPGAIRYRMLEESEGQ